ncbi:MAG: protein-L-isoaspartate(D-aspartate) O-methyltransferase [Calditrichia bacterium]
MMFAALREEMVHQFVVEKGIEDERVIEAMRRVPRHRFVDPALRHQAYSGLSLPIGFGQTISHPTTVAFMTQALELTGEEKVLEIGTGSGYQAAVLAEIGANVFTVERIPQLAERARKILEELNYYTVAVQIGDGTAGWSVHAPYQRIMVTAAASQIPRPLVEQLAEGGIIVMPLEDNSRAKLLVGKRVGEKLLVQQREWRKFVPLVSRNGRME